MVDIDSDEEEESTADSERRSATVRVTEVDVRGLGQSVDPRLWVDDSNFLTFNFSKASVKFMRDFEVSKEKPSRLLDDMLRLRGLVRGAGSETDRGEVFGEASVSIADEDEENDEEDGVGFEMARLTIGFETIRETGRARGPDPKEEG